MRKIAGIDIGNSRIKILFLDKTIAIENNSDYLSIINQFFSDCYTLSLIHI